MADFTRFIQEAKSGLSERQVYTDELLVKAYSVDGSPFEPIARVVVDIYNPEQLGLLLDIARKTGVSLTYRGSGTGVSGQTIARDVTVRLPGPYWKRIDVLDDGERVRARCGVIGAEVNAALKPYGRYMTADPSSISAASIGGMAPPRPPGSAARWTRTFTADDRLHSPWPTAPTWTPRTGTASRASARATPRCWKSSRRSGRASWATTRCARRSSASSASATPTATA